MNCNVMSMGYSYDEYMTNNIKVTLDFQVLSHQHLIVTGSSGSGKSNAVLWLLTQYMKAVVSNITICDYKAGKDWNFLVDYPNYYSGVECVEAIQNYYEEFKKAKDMDKTYHLLIIDEYPALISYLTTQDKLNKTKIAVEVQSIIFEILAMGRSRKCGLWIVAQRPDANLFLGGSRDNFMVSIALGNLSREHKAMLFSGYELPNENTYKAGEGLMYADGYGITEVKYPLLKDIDLWKYHIFRLLMEDYLE